MALDFFVVPTATFGVLFAAARRLEQTRFSATTPGGSWRASTSASTKKMLATFRRNSPPRIRQDAWSRRGRGSGCTSSSRSSPGWSSISSSSCETTAWWSRSTRTRVLVMKKTRSQKGPAVRRGSVLPGDACFGSSATFRGASTTCVNTTRPKHSTAASTIRFVRRFVPARCDHDSTRRSAGGSCRQPECRYGWCS